MDQEFRKNLADWVLPTLFMWLQSSKLSTKLGIQNGSQVIGSWSCLLARHLLAQHRHVSSSWALDFSQYENEWVSLECRHFKKRHSKIPREKLEFFFFFFFSDIVLEILPYPFNPMLLVKQTTFKERRISFNLSVGEAAKNLLSTLIFHLCVLLEKECLLSILLQ